MLWPAQITDLNIMESISCELAYKIVHYYMASACAQFI